MVERRLPKPKVAGSRPVVRFTVVRGLRPCRHRAGPALGAHHIHAHDAVTVEGVDVVHDPLIKQLPVEGSHDLIDLDVDPPVREHAG